MDHRHEVESFTGALVDPTLDDVVAAQEFDARASRVGDDPERGLMLAILEDAVACVRRSQPSRETAQALAWILEEAPERFCSFENICELLELDAQYVRRRVLESVSWARSLPLPILVRHEKRTIPVKVAA